MAARTITMDELGAAVKEYAARHELTVSSNEKGFCLMPGDVVIALQDGKPSCSNAEILDSLIEILMDLAEEPAKAPQKPNLPPEAPITPQPPQKPAYEPVTKPSPPARGFRPAQRKKAKLRLGVTGPAGSGKTMSALLIAGGLVNGDYSKVGLVDTENGSGDLYANSSQIGEYNILPLEPPFEANKYINAIHLAEDAGLEVIILDSITHAWAGEGGFLDKQGKIADRTGNSFAAWRTVTPEHNRFIDAMLQSKIHVIATMRSKTEHVYENGKVKKLGMAPVAREGMEYEFTVVFDIDQSHNATPTKDRTSMFDGQIFKPSPDTGKKLLTWLEAKA